MQQRALRQQRCRVDTMYVDALRRDDSLIVRKTVTREFDLPLLAIYSLLLGPDHELRGRR
jgi:hypothetical protein